VVGRLANSAASAAAQYAVDGSFYVRFASHDQVAVGLPDPRMLLSYARGQASAAGLHPDSLTSMLSGGAAVTLQANNDITFGNTITVNNPSDTGGAIIAQAGRSLLLNASITTDDAPLTLIANDQLASGVVDSQRDAGAASITAAGGATINAGTAEVTVDLRDGAGKTNTTRGGVTLGQVTGALRIVSGTLTPGGAIIGTTTVIGSLSLSGGLNLNVDGAASGQADRVEVTGSVTVSGALLISMGSTYLPKKNDRIVLISNDGSDAVIGTFSGLPEGSAYIIGGRQMLISYKGGDGNDVALQTEYIATYLPLIRR
jgi:hypothetical protein